MPWTKYGGINFGWLAVWVPSPDWPGRILENATFDGLLGEAAAPGGGECGPCPDFASNTLAFDLQLRKIMENLSQGNRRALGCSRDGLTAQQVYTSRELSRHLRCSEQPGRNCTVVPHIPNGDTRRKIPGIHSIPIQLYRRAQRRGAVLQSQKVS